MVFSFFKRKGEEPQTMVPPKPVAPKPLAGAGQGPPTSGAPAPSQDPRAHAHTEGAEFDDLTYDGASASAESHSAVEEAAILYANERIHEAIGVLLGFIKENAEVRDLHPWLLLFDLYQTQDMRTPFEELSMEFIVRFERSAPVWEGPRLAAQKTHAPKSNMASSVLLKSAIDESQAAEIARLEKAVGGEAGVKLDLSGASAIAEPQAEQLAQVLRSLRQAEKRVTLVAGAAFAEHLKAALAAAPGTKKPLWALLFELYQLCGMQNEFEDAAVDYAVTFELSPPSWEPLPETMQQAVEAAEVEPTASSEECFSIEGVLATGNDYKLRDLERHAETREQVLIDMSATSRVDFVTVGAFINTLIMLNQKGKQVTISGANEMVHALFDVMGVTEYATVMRRKSR